MSPNTNDAGLHPKFHQCVARACKCRSAAKRRRYIDYGVPRGIRDAVEQELSRRNVSVEKRRRRLLSGQPRAEEQDSSGESDSGTLSEGLGCAILLALSVPGFVLALFGDVESLGWGFVGLMLGVCFLIAALFLSFVVYVWPILSRKKSEDE